MKHAATCLDRGSREAIDAHFRGRITADEEASMRAHLSECEACRTHYERHLLYTELTGRGLTPAERLGRGLGFSTPRALAPWMTPGRWALSGLATAAGLALVLGGVHLSRQPERTTHDGFAARGAAAVTAAPELEIFRVDRHGRSLPVTGWITPDDELGFAYRNPGGARYLMVFAEDGSGDVYWFHPHWAVGTPAPQAVAIVPSGDRQELPGITKHRFAGKSLRLTALFSQQPLGAEEVERRLSAGQRFPEAVALEVELELRPEVQP